MTDDRGVQDSFETKLAAGELAITARDVELLQAISAHGSIYSAADALERSYSHAQRRIVELEDTIGPLVERQRGGVEGGGSTLTPTARELLRRFNRLETAFSGLTDAEVTVLDGEVVERTGELGIVETAAGRFYSLIVSDTNAVEVAIQADTVTLTAPEDAPPADETSAQNHVLGVVQEIKEGESIAQVTIDIGAETPLIAMITISSSKQLGLSPGQETVASFKATATRATSRDINSS
ncbi:TOBE domain-containing protein [Halegenticoccus tardaugens]|uniref:TOBE domain-containing protein n=1 Tax=Halegenticoccus tardaugens TaxID=2071624 RepID=UPI00100C152F|nr:TOBE domain-containing protein [Halegenticoccus tardaugens]